MGHSLSQLTLRFKLGFLNVGLRLYFEFFPNSGKYWKSGFLNVALVGLSNFSQFTRKIISLGSLYFQISPNSLKIWKIGIFESPLVSYFFRLWVFRACKGKGEPIYNEIASFQVNKYLYLSNNFVPVSVLEILCSSLNEA